MPKIAQNVVLRSRMANAISAGRPRPQLLTFRIRGTVWADFHRLATSTAMEFDVFSTPLPEFAAADVVQLVSVFTFGTAGGSANAAAAINGPEKIAARMR